MISTCIYICGDNLDDDIDFGDNIDFIGNIDFGNDDLGRTLTTIWSPVCQTRTG